MSAPHGLVPACPRPPQRSGHCGADHRHARARSGGRRSWPGRRLRPLPLRPGLGTAGRLPVPDGSSLMTSRNTRNPPWFWDARLRVPVHLRTAGEPSVSGPALATAALATLTRPLARDDPGYVDPDTSISGTPDSTPTGSLSYRRPRGRLRRRQDARPGGRPAPRPPGRPSGSGRPRHQAGTGGGDVGPHRVPGSTSGRVAPTMA